MKRKKDVPLGGSRALEGLDSSLLARGRQCTATSKRTGERCKRIIAPGFRTCATHGSSTRRSKTAAAKRIAEASGYAADMLVELMADPTIDIKQRTKIAQDLLNRAGYSGKTELVVSAEKPRWQQIMEEVIEVEAVTIFDEPGNIIDAEVVEDEPHELPQFAPRQLETGEAAAAKAAEAAKQLALEARHAKLRGHPAPKAEPEAELSGYEARSRRVLQAPLAARSPAQPRKRRRQ